MESKNNRYLISNLRLIIININMEYSLIENNFSRKKKKNSANVIHRYKISPRLLLELQAFHNIIFEGKRLYNFSMKTYDNIDIENEINKNDKILFELIIEKSCEILMMLGINKFNRNNYVIDFHQRNCCELEKEKYKWSVWHEDDFQVTNYPVWSVIYCIRKDKGVKGTKIKFSNTKSNKIDNIIIEEGDIIIFKGDIFHKPQETWGFGYLDTIKCYIKRKI